METFSLLLALCEGNPPVSGMELWSLPETFEQTITTLVNWDAMAPIKRPLNEMKNPWILSCPLM